MALSRRTAVGLGAVALGGVGFIALDGRDLFYDVLTEDFAGETLNAPEAYRLAQSGAITLIDIRRPDEWATTGSGQGAARLDMRRDDFIAALDELVGGERDTPIALICARGVRSARMGNRLRDAGFTQVIDIPEGMLGSGGGPGWINRGLPVRRDR